MPLFRFLLAPEAGHAGTQGQQLSPLQALLGRFGAAPMLLGVFAVFYFMLIRPQQQKQKERNSIHLRKVRPMRKHWPTKKQQMKKQQMKKRSHSKKTSARKNSKVWGKVKVSVMARARARVKVLV